MLQLSKSDLVMEGDFQLCLVEEIGIFLHFWAPRCSVMELNGL